VDNNSQQTYYLKEFLHNADSLHKMLFFNSPDAVMILNFNGLIIDVNDRARKLMGHLSEELIDKSLWGLIHKDNVAPVIIQFKKTFLGEVTNCNFKVMGKNTEISHVHMTCMPMKQDNKVLGVYAILKDVTEEKQLEESLHYAKHYDGLTNLLNRKAFESNLEEVIQKCAASKDCFTIMLIDINRFKFINDSLGYDTGDLILKEVTIKLKTFFNEKNLVSRMVADKFLILLKDIKNIETAKEVINEIRRLFNEPFYINDFELYIATSMGISIYPRDGRDTPSLMKRVEMSLNSAKIKGADSYEFHNYEENNNNYNKFILGNNLRRAIERNEFVIKYQPKIDPRSNKIIGAEALIRWKHPSKGMLCPKDFLGLVEEIGLMIPLGQWILEQVCYQIKQWEREGIAPIRISVNFSESQLIHKDFCDKLTNTLKDSEVDARFLEIEITEGVIKDNEERLISVLKSIKELGVHISMDDFGTGYSSLSKLRNFSVDTLKLSPAFIKDISMDPEGLEIVAAVIKLAHSLKMEVIAGGIESLEQLSILTKLNCDGLQGYLFNEPVLQDKFKNLLKIGKCYPKCNIGIDEDDDFNNRRDFFRIKFKKPLGADMSIFKVGGKKVNLGSTEVVVFDISAGGLRFLSDIKLPVKSDIVLVFETEILDEVLNLYGNVVWMRHYEEAIFEYGLEFVFDEKYRETMLQLLNQLQFNIRNQKGLDNYRLVKRVYIKK
jgi:diguanylate cyclase (GGDEF)-like protein/PAS domain S-box-containing protein